MRTVHGMKGKVITTDTGNELSTVSTRTPRNASLATHVVHPEGNIVALNTILMTSPTSLHQMWRIMKDREHNYFLQNQMR